MQRAELLAELERLAAEAALARARLAEAHARLRSLRERLSASEGAAHDGEMPATSAG